MGSSDFGILKPFAEQGLIFLAFVIFTIGVYTGKLRFNREFKALEEINTRLSEVVSQNSRTTSESVQTTQQLLRALEQAIEELKEAKVELERSQIALAAVEERRRR